ncbi:hypothetical protein BH10ACI3_BH10ACI3_16210 [soil metagenome]
MKVVDFSTYIVLYNLVIGVLMMLSSYKVAELAGSVNEAHAATITRLTHTSVFTFGACVALLSGFIYVAFHLLVIGL